MEIPIKKIKIINITIMIYYSELIIILFYIILFSIYSFMTNNHLMLYE